jgi:hypothetical protein
MKADIRNIIRKYFTDIERVKIILSKLDVPKEEKDRVLRCILYLSDHDYDSLEHWVKKANQDRRDIYFFAEYDNRNERK